MKRKKAASQYKLARWTQNQKLEFVSTYLQTGNLRQTCFQTDVPLDTAKGWKTTAWWKDMVLALQQEEGQKTSADIDKIIKKSLLAVEERLDNGDAQMNVHGDLVRIPVKAHVALKITTDLLTRRDKLNAAPVREELEQTIADRLSMLSQEFQRFATMKTIDVAAVEVK